MDNNKQSLRKADFIMAIILYAVSIFFSINSIKLIIRTISKKGEWYISAGLVPLLVCILLFICATVLLVNSLKSGISFKNDLKTLKSKLLNRQFLSTAFIVGWFALYIFIFLKYLPYEVSTIIFLEGFIIAFSQKNLKKMIIGAAVSVITTLLIVWCFGNLVGIPLP